MESILFKSEAHKARFLMAMQQIGKIYSGKLDQEYAAALYILTSKSALWVKASGFVSSDGIEIQDMLDEVDFGGGDSVLVKLAGNLFNGNQRLDDARELMRLDNENFEVALTALRLRRRSYRVDEL